MSQFVLQENSDGSVGLVQKKQVLAEVCGKVISVNAKNRNLFTIHAEKMDRKFRCVLSYPDPFCPVRDGDAIFGIAEYVQDSRYGDTLNLIQPPFVMLGEDKNTVTTSFIGALKGTGFGAMKAHELIDTLIMKTGSLSNAISTLDRMSSHFNYKNLNDPAILDPYSTILKEGQMLKLLEWWYKNRNLRRLWLLGINNTEIRNSKIPPEEMYQLCLSNPYKITSLPLDKCDSICKRLGQEPAPEIKKCAEISRKLNEYTESKGWTGIPSKILVSMFPDVSQYVGKLKEIFDIKTELHTAYLPYPHQVEVGITDLICDLLDIPTLPHAIQPSEITYTRDDLSNDQKMVIEKALSDNICVIRGAAGSGKCLHPHTPILMSDGSVKKIMDIVVGESVMGPDSKPRNVLSRCNGIDQMYRIVPSKGRMFICNDPHILTLKGIEPFIKIDRNKNSPYIVRYSINGLIKSKGFKSIDMADTFKNSLNEDIFDIPLNEYLKRTPQQQRYNYLFHVGIDFPEKDVPFDPYTIGIWLGDGSSTHSQITNIDQEILSKVETEINKYKLTLKQMKNDIISYQIVGQGDNYWIKGNNAFAATLRNLNLFGNKHIPDIYKINSRDVRLKLLAGLIDSDGYNAGNYYEIMQKNKKLSDDIEYLAFSLGFMVTRREVKKGCMYNGEMKYDLYQRIFIMGDGLDKIPVVLARKKCYPRKSKTRATCLRFTVEPIGSSIYHGFELDGDGRFLLGDFTVTHNTSVIKEIIHNLQEKGIKYRVVSFTGKAVARIREVIDQKEPMTMHMTITMAGKKETPQFHHLIVDEASMVTSELLYEFTQKFGHEYRITLIGDPNQLTPISWGTMFDQAIKSGVVPTYTLTTCHRVENEDSGILINANNIVECSDPHYNGPPFEFEEGGSFNIVDGNLSTIKDLIKVLQDNGVTSDKITVISPYNKYLPEINKICQDIFNDIKRSVRDDKGISWRIGDRVMMTENNYKINVMNGDEGTISDLSEDKIQVTFKDGTSHVFDLSHGTNIKSGDDPVKEVVPTPEEEMNCRKILTTDSLVHSFAVSVHRYQGSEADYVIFYLPESPPSKFLNRNLIYTGITRAKKLIWMVGHYNTMIRAATTSPAYRCDNLAIRLKEARKVNITQ